MSRIYLLPGMGADRNMYSDSWLSLSNASFLNWPPFQGEDSIFAVAQRLISSEKILQDSIVIGSSLGGIVACEIANQLNLRHLILIGSAKQKEEISSLLSLLHPLIDLAPLKFIQHLTKKVPTELTQMFSKSDPKFIRAMCRAIFNWEGLICGRIDPIRIHGAKDRVIPLPKNIQYVLNGGHLLAITHAADCVKIVSDVTSRIH